jgi:hypothetical protein
VVDNKNEWRLPTLNKKILLIGSSNLARINQTPHPDMQVAIYPGAKINHIRNMVRKHNEVFQPQRIILNIGINDKDELQHDTSQRIENLFSTMRSKFPKAKVHFAKLNYSKHLTTTQKRNIQFVNSRVEALRAKVPILPSLPVSEFQVVEDNIHWTECTANRMYNSWLSHLNLN